MNTSRKAYALCLFAAALACACLTTSAQTAGRTQGETSRAPRAESQTQTPGRGKLDGPVYTNDYFGLSIRIPEGWTVHGEEAKQQLAGATKEAFTSDDERTREQINASVDRTQYLLIASKHPDSSNVSFNPALMIAAERLAGGMRTAADALREVKRAGRYSRYDFQVTEEIHTEKLGGAEFAVMAERITLPGKPPVSQKYYMTARGGYALGVVVTYVDAGDLKTAEDAVKSIRFETPDAARDTARAVRPKNADEHLAAGLELQRGGEGEKALEEFRAALRLDPRMSEARQALGVAYGELGRYEEGALSLSQAIEENESDPRAHFNLGRLYVTAGLMEAAVGAFGRALALDPAFPKAHHYLGAAYERLGRLEEAAAASREAVRLDPQDATSYFNLGLASQKLGRHDDAVEAFKRAIILNPTSGDAHLWLGESYVHKGDYEKALPALKEAARLKPNETTPFSALGKVYGETGRYEEALEPLRQVVRLQPDDPESHFHLGNTYMMAGQYDKAIASLGDALRLKPDHALAGERLRVATNRKHIAQRLESYKQEAADHPENASARARLAQVFNALGMYADAEREYAAALRLEPSSADYHNGAAINYAEWGKPERAIEHYERAARLKPHHVLYFSVGNSYQKLGRLDEAVEAYRKSLELKPTFAHALYELGAIHSKRGRYQEAIASFVKVLESEPTHVYANHALGTMYVITGDKTGAMRQYHILKNLNADVAANLLRMISK